MIASDDGPPADFRRRFRAHNVHAVVMAALSAGGAIVIWNFAYFFFVLILLGLTTAVHGDWGPERPAWIGGTALALAVALLVWGVADRIAHRFAEVPDRPIIGWHLFQEFLLLPVRLTFAVSGNAGAILAMNDHRLRRAWELLRTISVAGRAPLSSLTLVEPDPNELHRALRALQLTGCIDLHPGQQDWFYTVRSDLATSLQHRLAGRGPS